MSGQKTSETPVIPVGMLLAYFRGRRKVSVHGLAELSGLSHTYLGALERGDASLSAEAAEKITAALGLSDDDWERLRQAALNPDPLVAPGFMVSAETLQEREESADVLEVWVVERRPIELDRPDWLGIVSANLLRKRSYVYFVPNRLVWQQLRKALVGVTKAKVVDSMVMCIEVGESLQPFFFNPQFALYLQRGGRPVIGVWAFRGPYSHAIDCGCAMEQAASDELYLSLQKVVEHARMGEAYPLPAHPFSVLHSPRLNSGLNAAQKRVSGAARR